MQAQPEPQLDVASPCVGICQLDAASICSGCGRSINEIAEWSRASEARKQRIVELAVIRRSIANEIDHG